MRLGIKVRKNIKLLLLKKSNAEKPKKIAKRFQENMSMICVSTFPTSIDRVCGWCGVVLVVFVLNNVSAGGTNVSFKLGGHTHHKMVAVVVAIGVSHKRALMT